MTKNQAYLERSLQAVWHPCTQMKAHEKFPLIPISRGEGVWLYDFEGNRYLDAVSSWWVNLFGHANPQINTAVRAQLDQLEHVMLAGFTHEPVIQLSEKLAALTGGKLGHCFYASDGASAIEIALKMSFHYWRNQGQPGKCNFVALSNGYHGETVGALSITDVPIFREAYAGLLRPAATIMSPDWRQAAPDEDAQAYALRCADKLENHLEQQHQTIAALILEPLIQCAGGMAMYHPEYLRRAREICNRYNVHLIADEIAVGCGRTGTFFACEQADITADFLCLSKGISGGYLPLSVVMTTDEIYSAFYSDDVTRGFLHSHSYTGNPLACSAALATLAIFEENGIIASNRVKAVYLNKRAETLATHPKVENFRNTGMIWAFDIKSDDPAFSRNFFAAALRQELLLRPIGKTVYFMLPYVITEAEIDLLLARTCEILDSLP
ncbi:MAG: adenosylmethionine--8-amino-7-oxononanoate transaminase [Pseudomonadota bacterium]